MEKHDCCQTSLDGFGLDPESSEAEAMLSKWLSQKECQCVYCKDMKTLSPDQQKKVLDIGIEKIFPKIMPVLSTMSNDCMEGSPIKALMDSLTNMVSSLSNGGNIGVISQSPESKVAIENFKQCLMGCPIPISVEKVADQRTDLETIEQELEQTRTKLAQLELKREKILHPDV